MILGSHHLGEKKVGPIWDGDVPLTVIPMVFIGDFLGVLGDYNP